MAGFTNGLLFCIFIGMVIEYYLWRNIMQKLIKVRLLLGASRYVTGVVGDDLTTSIYSTNALNEDHMEAVKATRFGHLEFSLVDR